MIISVTERGTFRRCKQQWDYASFNRQHLTSVTPPTALSFGTLIHKMHEEWLLNPDEPVEDIVLRVSAQTLKELKQHYTQAIGVEPDNRELAGFYDQVTLASAVMLNYKEQWGSSLPEGYTLVQPEQTLVIPIPGTEHKVLYEENGVGHYDTEYHHLEATLDGLMKDEAGRLWVLERKTFGQHPKEDALQRNDQFIAYLWAIRQLDLGPIGGIFYDGMWKRDGSKHSLDQLFYRTPLIRSPEEINQFEEQLRDEALDMASPDLRIYRNIPWQGCWDCQFQRLCDADYRGEDSAYIRERFYMQRERNDWQNVEQD